MTSIVCLFIAWSQLCFAQTPLQLFSDSGSYSLTTHFEVLKETDRRLSIEEVLQQQDQFTEHGKANPNFGFAQHGLWLRATLDNISNIKDWLIDINYSQNDYVDFYLVDGESVFYQSYQGKLQGQQRYRLPSFDVTLPIDQPVILYIRLESRFSSVIAPTFVQPNQSHLLMSQIDSIAWGLFYGGLVILAIYNLVLFINVREISLVTYITYIVSVLLWQFVWGGHIQLFYQGGLPLWIASHTELIFILIGIASGVFTLAFLETKTTAVRMHPVVILFIVLQLILGIFFLSGLVNPVWKNTAVYVLGMLAVIANMAAAVEAVLVRFQPALYFLSAWILLALGATVSMLSLIGIIPTNTLTTYSFQIGVFLQAGLFSVALMDKSRGQLKDEVATATNDLRNNMELIEEQNVRLDIARKDAIKASNIKSQFLANMSHEIRTPLNAILGFSKELEQTTRGQEQKEQVRIINSAADNLLTIVNDVLDFSKIEAGKLQVSNQAFSPMNLFEEMVAIMAKSAHIKGLDFVFVPHTLPDKLIGDAIRLKQVLTNLLGNALKFTATGHITLSVSCSRRAHGVIDLKFNVADTGIGISRKDRKKLFSAFSQVDDSLNRNYQGTGLGLVISQELVRLMNGTITLRSSPGQGSVFSVVVRTNQLSQRALVLPSSNWKDKTVLVFDPFPESRRATASMLRDAGAKVESIDSLDYLQQCQTKPDFLLVFLPNHSRYSSMEIMHCAMTIDAKDRVVWYNQHDPLVVSPIFESHFSQSLRMPATPARLEGLHANSNQKRASKLPYATRKFPKANVLAVDDMAMNLMLLETWFKEPQVTLTLAYSGKEAIELCQQHAYDLILMDVQMPNMDGLTASKHIRKTELNIGTPIIAVTAHAFKEEQDRLLASGMDDYLPKPVALEELIDVMFRWCDAPAEEEQDRSKVLDLQLAMKRANNNEDTSKIMLQEFIGLIPEAGNTIKQLHAKSDNTNLLHEIHRLHGASCYTGAPEIQALAHDIEISLKKKQMETVNQLVPQLLDAMRRFENEGKAALNY